MILQTATSSFKVELPQGIHNFGPTSPDTFKIALYTAAADLGYATAAYTTTGEVVGSGYAAGGNTLVITTTPVVANNSDNVPTAFFSFANSSWASATFTARAALIYNATKGNKSVAVLDFGSDKTGNNIFQVIFPAANADSAILRIS